MPFNIQGPELIIILIIALIVIGPGKLPDVGAALGKSIREFRKAASDVRETASLDAPAPAPRVTPPPAAAPPATVAAPAPATTPAPVAAAPGAPVATTPDAASAPSIPESDRQTPVS